MNGPPNDGAPHPADATPPRQYTPPMLAGQSTSVAVTETSSAAVAAREKAAVEARFLMAVHRPRNPDNARARLLARCGSPRFAEVAEYAKPIGGAKKARGASIRMMEEIARNWGNIDVQAPVVFDDAERRIIRVTATDLETNYSASTDVMLEKTVERRSPRQGDEVIGQRTNSQGEITYRIVADEDAFLVKQNANVSKTRRECIRAIVPGDLVDEAMECCAKTRQTEVRSDPSAARKRIADSFFAAGVMPAQLCDLLGKPSLEAVTEAEIEMLRSLFSAMRDGESTWADIVEAHASGRSAAGAGPAASPTTGGAGSRLREAAARSKSGVPAAETPRVDPTTEEIRRDDLQLVAQEEGTQPHDAARRTPPAR